MSMNTGQLVELALGKEEARKVDYAIPQGVFDAMTEHARNDRAGWYYAPECKLSGRLLTQSECWTEIKRRLRSGKLKAFLRTYPQAVDMTEIAVEWPCLRSHVERSEILITEADSDDAKDMAQRSTVEFSPEPR